MLRKVILFIGTVGAAALLITGTASAQQYPSVSNLKPFSPEANFMSLSGYLRYLVHQQTSQWLTHDEADRAVKQQGM